jgi:predicted Zn-dependent peptidase
VRGLVTAIRARHPRRGGELVQRPAPAWGHTWASAFPDAEQAMVYVAAPAPAPDSSDWLAVTLHHSAFTASMNSPLTRAVRGDEGLSYDVSSVLSAERGWGMHFFSAQPHGSRVQYVLDRVVGAWNAFGADLPDESALAEVVRHVTGTHRVGLETVRQRLAYAMRLVEIGRPLRYMAELPDRLAAIDRSALERAHGLYGWSQPTTVVAVLPGGAGDAQWSASRVVRAIEVNTVL